MVIGDGILTPAISVLSAMDGVRAAFPSIKSSVVEALSAVVLILLFFITKVWHISSELPIFPHYGCMDFEYPARRNL